MTGVPTIVVVDDAAEVRSLVRSRLRLSGLLDVVADGASGREAVNLAEQHQPDLMLLDVSMPEMDGLSALPHILSASPHTRVVMYSGFAEDGLSDRCQELGAAAFFEKSTSLETLAGDLLSVLHGGRRPDPPKLAEVVVAPHDSGPDESAQAVLHEHLERFQEVFEEAAIGMATMTLAGGVVRCNRKLAQLLGRSAEELVGALYADLAGADGDRVRAALRQVVSGGRDVARLQHMIGGSGRTRRVETMLSPVRDASNRSLYVFLQVQEVGDSGESVEILRLLVSAVEDYAIFMLDPDGHVASWNPGAERSKGWTADEIIGQHFRVFYPPDKQSERHPEHELEIALRDGRYSEEGWRVRKDGTQFWAHVTITAVHDRDGALVGFGKVTRDNTERREANARLEEANARLHQAAEEQAHFLAMTAHELRSPVGVLGGTARILRDHWADLAEDERSELLAGMTGSAERLSRLLADLLTASRIRGSALDLKLVELPLAEELESIVRGASGNAEPGEVRLGEVPDVVVLADADRLAQMLENLITNSFRYGAAPIDITVEPGPDVVSVVVADAGPGIPADLAPKLFERFATSGQGGTGLGLFIVRELARAQGGDAAYRPHDQAFVITLPVAGGGS
jgi:PAS domain S-box-containing protein